jgi:hypothetical protein
MYVCRHLIKALPSSAMLWSGVVARKSLKKSPVAQKLPDLFLQPFSTICDLVIRWLSGGLTA